MTSRDAPTLGLSPDAPPGGGVRPDGVARPHVVDDDESAVEALIAESTEAPPSVPAVNPFEAMVRAIEAVREELAGRDGELRDALMRIARLYERLATGRDGAPGGAGGAVGARAGLPALAPAAPAPSGADEDTLRMLLRSIDTLATVTEASITRASDLSRSMQYLVEAVQGLTNRVDSLVGRTDTADARLESIAHTVDALSEQVTMLGRRLSAPAPPPRPRLRAIGRDDAGSSA
ncbi:MAG TPA: hypothetical protein VI916_07210 [Acidimicrobiia bacterium]|nr:hypothetical protein [Acidimicrobiia bacterium]